jgi:hypothetical protein
MTLHRLDADQAGVCRAPKTVNTPLIDAGPIYGSSKEHLQNTLRAPNSCNLRTSAGNLLPVTTKPNANTNRHDFVAGDSRVSEHAMLTSLHTIWVREHNRVCDVLARQASPDSVTTTFAANPSPALTVDQMFEKARKVQQPVTSGQTNPQNAEFVRFMT